MAAWTSWEVSHLVVMCVMLGIGTVMSLAVELGAIRIDQEQTGRVLYVGILSSGATLLVVWVARPFVIYERNFSLGYKTYPPGRRLMMKRLFGGGASDGAQLEIDETAVKIKNRGEAAASTTFNNNNEADEPSVWRDVELSGVSEVVPAEDV